MLRSETIERLRAIHLHIHAGHATAEGVANSGNGGQRGEMLVRSRFPRVHRHFFFFGTGVATGMATGVTFAPGSAFGIFPWMIGSSNVSE